MSLIVKGSYQSVLEAADLYWELDRCRIENAVTLPAPTSSPIPCNGTNEGYLYGAYIEEHITHISTKPHLFPFLLYSSLNQSS